MDVAPSPTSSSSGVATEAATHYRYKPFAGSPHAWAIAQGRSIDPGAVLRVLDVGAAAGDVGLALKEAREGKAELSGVEIDERARAALAKRYARACSSIDELDQDARFDLGLLLDVIEHTPDPRATLERAAKALKPGGTLLVSVPNVAHWSVRGALLFGRFEYKESGILDRTHLRFFTRRSFLRTLREAGLTVESESFAIEPIELIFPSFDRNLVWRALRQVRRALAWIWPGLMAFQLLARCRTRA